MINEPMYYYPDDNELWTKSAMIDYYNNYYYQFTELSCDEWIEDFIDNFCIRIRKEDIHV